MGAWVDLEADDYAEDADRINKMAAEARKRGMTVPLGVKLPRLKKDGSIDTDGAKDNDGPDSRASKS